MAMTIMMTMSGSVQMVVRGGLFALGGEVEEVASKLLMNGDEDDDGDGDGGDGGDNGDYSDGGDDGDYGDYGDDEYKRQTEHINNGCSNYAFLYLKQI